MQHNLLILLFLFTCTISFAHSLTNEVEFTCDGGTTKIDLTRVNDDYCDCVVDGTDELKTSACAHLDTMFVCVSGEKNITSSFVGDGICDCCDGSDEHLNPRVRCENVCDKYFKEQEDDIKREIAFHSEGEEIKKTYIRKSAKPYKELEGSMKSMKKEVTEAQAKIREMYLSQKYDQYTIQSMYSKVMEKTNQYERLQSMVDNQAFGAKKQYFPLLGKCFKKFINEKASKGGSYHAIAKNFTFEFCPFQYVTQVEEPIESSSVEATVTLTEGGNVETQKTEKPKPTTLGYWAGWNTMDNLTTIYTNGDECWNGPKRLVSVTFICKGEKEEIVRLTENGKCLYDIVFATPAACSKDRAKTLSKLLKQENANTQPVHDEL